MTTQAIAVRKPRLDFSAAAIPHHYLHGNPIKSHFFNALNLLFPDGERFFVKAVHDHQGAISDPALLREIRGFAGQEGQHANQHERFFAVLEAQGYQIRGLLGFFRRLVRTSRYFPKGLRLSLTAGAEHLTATMAQLVFQHDLMHDCDPTMRKLIEWHALEEIEHKSVAYDVFAATHPRGYVLRMLGYGMAVALIAAFAYFGTRLLVAQDLRQGRLTRKGLGRAFAELSDTRSRAFRQGVRRSLLVYLRPGFHPDQQDDSAILRDLGPRVIAALG